MPRKRGRRLRAEVVGGNADPVEAVLEPSTKPYVLVPSQGLVRKKLQRLFESPELNPKCLLVCEN